MRRDTRLGAMRQFLVHLLTAWVLLMLSPPGGLFAGQGPTARFTMDSLERSWGDCLGKPCVTLRVRYPLITQLQPPRFRDSLNAFIQETLLGKFDPRGVAPILSAVLDTLAAQHRTLAPEQAGIPWLIERTIDIIGDTLGILTLDVQEFRSTGGAHPLTMHLLSMMAPSTMKTLSLDDLVSQDQKEKLTAEAEISFRTARRIPPGEDLTKAGFTFPNGKFALTLNVGLTRAGMVFLYNPYEIAPYVFGPTRIAVPWKGLRGILSRNEPGR